MICWIIATICGMKSVALGSKFGGRQLSSACKVGRSAGGRVGEWVTGWRACMRAREGLLVVGKRAWPAWSLSHRTPSGSLHGSAWIQEPPHHVGMELPDEALTQR